MSMVQQAIEVGAPLHTVYEQVAAFENYPRFMTGVQRVVPIGADRSHWVMEVDGHKREFDARIVERSLDERVSWSSIDGPLVAETITLRPLGETRTQVVAQLEADIAALLPSDRHGQETLSRRLKDDLVTLKGLVESGAPGVRTLTGASSKQLSGTAVSPATVAARIKRRTTPEPHPGAGWGTGSGDAVKLPDGDSASLRAMDADDDAGRPGRRIERSTPVRGGAGGGRTSSGSAPMGGRTAPAGPWGAGLINEEDRGSAHDY